MKNIRKLKKAEYDMECETTCRVMIDLMLIECKLAFLELLDISPRKKASAPAKHSGSGLRGELRASDNSWSQSAPCEAAQDSANKQFLASQPKSGDNDGSSPSTSGGATPDSPGKGFPAPRPKSGGKSTTGGVTPGSGEEGITFAISSTPPPAYARNPQKLTIYPELDMNVEIEDTRNASKTRKLRISGKADWAFAYGERQDSCLGNILIAVEAKNPATFSGARSQLLTYLAIMQRLRLQHDRVNRHVQGFYSDGWRYGFLAITNDGEILESSIFSIGYPEQLKLVFNWIVALVVTSVMSSPTTSPTKEEQLRNEEIAQFTDRVFVRYYTSSYPADDEDDMFVDLDDPNVELYDCTL